MNQPPDNSNKEEKLVILPDWITCSDKLAQGTASALERFIYHHQPAIEETTTATIWREHLEEALQELILLLGSELVDLTKAHETVEKNFRLMQEEFALLKTDIEAIVKRAKP